jgi:uncharacterized protein YaeQ
VFGDCGRRPNALSFGFKSILVTLGQKSTIYKFRIALSDLERNYYDALNLTIAQHPSESQERMVARVLAFGINAKAGLVFTKGLSSVEEPDIWIRTLDEKTDLWIDVGEPSVDRIKKAARLSNEVKVYSFNSKSVVWWKQGQPKFALLNASFFRFDPMHVKDFAALVERRMDISITITGNSAYIATTMGECEVTWEPLQVV